MRRRFRNEFPSFCPTKIEEAQYCMQDENMEATVFVVQHVHEFGEDDEDVKMIGVYSTRGKAEEAVERLRAQPGFRDAPEGFFISAYLLDRDHWTEGYTTERL